MAEGTQVRTRPDALLTELLREVDTLRPYVRFQLRGWPNEVDAVLQIARETVWHRSSTFDPKRGSPHAFVFGITRHVVLREIERKHVPMDGVPDDVESASDIDPLEVMIRRFDAHRWMVLVADFVGPSDWHVMSDLSLADGDAERVAGAHQLSRRTVRTIHDRVCQTARTVLAALAAADAGLPLTGSVIVSCVPETGGFREVAEMIGDDPGTIAANLHIHPGSARARIATAKRLLMIARTVLEQEVAA
ncbi:sigma factor [Leifsonia sp. 21MFCrub1.1]|uniref:sigma factor n=1 Tax=Leifsonia sp. 21MFCrub1.1 TaxID=1798223 RepID=UPI000892A2F1|nr:sigma factor [Leifsonia sp. 21MFCrub1.1]SEB10316.1 Sigma-70 region 2 [Leifsonia sp. 21MFCrub1.1]